MGRTSAQTLLPLLKWGEIMGISPWHLCQIDAPEKGQCEDVWYQYAWQRDALSRDEVGRAIARAERVLANFLGYWPAPTFTVNEQVSYPRDVHGSISPLSAYMEPRAVAVRWKKVRGAGILARSTISDGVNVVLSDADADGVNDTFTCTFATTVTDPNEIALYFTAADRLGRPLNETWRVRPVEVVIDGGNATVSGFIGLLVKPLLQTTPSPNEVTNEVASFVTTLDAKRVYLDTTHTDETPNQGYAMWYRVGCNEDEEDCLLGTSAVCVGDSYSAMGRLYAKYNLCDAEWFAWTLQPDKLNLNYLSGLPLVDGEMDPDMADIVAHLATTYLTTENCGCEGTRKILDYWRASPTIDEPEGSRSLIDGLSANPFGYREGAIYAWERAQSLFGLDSVGV